MIVIPKYFECIKRDQIKGQKGICRVGAAGWDWWVGMGVLWRGSTPLGLTSHSLDEISLYKICMYVDVLYSILLMFCLPELFNIFSIMLLL